MSLPCKECGLVVLVCFFQKQFNEENKHALVKYNIFFFASVSLLTHLNIQ